MGRKKEEIVIEESGYLAHSKDKAMNMSIAEGSFHSAAVNVASSFLTPFALAIGGNSFHIGLMSSLSGLSEPFGELTGSRLMEKHSRKKILIRAKMLNILLYLPIIVLAYLSFKGILSFYLPYALILIWVVFEFIFGVGYVSWFSWMGDLVPAESRGKYFAKRNRVAGLVGLVSFVLAGFVLDMFKTRGFVLLGFTVLFLFGMIFRGISRHLTKKIFNPELRIKKGYYFSFKDFVKKYDNYGKFAFYQAVFFFAIMISSPFFAVYMLEDLKFSYITFTIVAISSTVFYLIFSPLAGKFSDKYGNLKLLYISAFLFPLVPLLWVFLKTPMQLILLPSLISGVANAAFVIGTTDFAYDLTSQQKRGLCLAYTSMLIGLGVLFGGLLGGVLIQFAGIGFIKPIFFVFILSAVLMALASLFFLPQLKEWRKTDKLQGLSVDLTHPFKMVHADAVWFKNFIHQKS